MVINVSILSDADDGRRQPSLRDGAGKAPKHAAVRPGRGPFAHLQGEQGIPEAVAVPAHRQNLFV